jgi:hypothetical protein
VTDLLLYDVLVDKSLGLANGSHFFLLRSSEPSVIVETACIQIFLLLLLHVGDI